MERNRKCILCETVYGSKQEMDEHMRSMLHHRELEKLKGRDCGHECRVCGVTVVSLTEYASHISSSCHKQNVDKNPGGGELSQDYFDQALVDLIQKRKDKIRKENEAAAAKAAKEEEEKRKKEEFQQKLQEAKERYRLARVWQPPLQGHRHQFSWNQNQASAERAQADQYTKKGKGATWHAQAPPNLQKWGSGDLTCEGRGGSSKTWGHGTFQRSQQNYLPNNGPPPFFQFPAGWFGQTPNQPQNTDKATQQHPGAWGAGSEHSSRSNCNNPVPDRGCRWSPYPVTTAHQTEAHPHAPEISKGPKTKQDKTAETGAFIPNRCEKTGGHLRKVDSAPRDESRVSGFHRDASVSNQQADGKISSAVRGGAQLKKAAGQTGSHRPILDFSPAALQTGSKKSCARGREETNSEIPAHMKETHKFCSSAKPDTSDLAGPLESAAPSSDNTPSLQSLQVSTSVLDSPRPTGSVREEEDGGRDGAVESEQSLNPDASKSSEAASNTPHSSKLDLPHVLKWELSKHINSKNKAGGHEPNLNIARRVRNLSGSRKHEADRDSGLKPTVRQLLNSSGSRRCVNWEQLYDTLRKKQDKGKGMPRFGIEMVPNEQDCPRQEEEALLEGFDWDLVTDFSSQGPTRKRSLSESSLAPSSFSLSDPHASEEPLRGSEQLSATAPPQQHPAAHKQPDTLMSASVKVLQRSESVGGDSSSGMEQCDAQGSGKRRRAATDGQSAEASCLEHNSKRRKVKSKKERQQVDQLLSVSLREEELSRSLQTLDSNLIQARSTLEAAFMEVQRLTLLKQQITAEMSMLRNTRIDLLKGMQGKKLPNNSRNLMKRRTTIQIRTGAPDAPKQEMTCFFCFRHQ
uniref:Zinc finger protein 106a n=1 Tax=Oryzias melastigma TaxID=30732 RepID=A0A3B3BM18_ORYME